MAFASADRVKETSTTTGTGTYNLAGASTGFRTFVAGIGNGNTCHYVAENGVDWEVGLGTVTDATPDTLARTRILASSNAGSAVNWGAGTREVYCSPLASAFQNIRPLKGYIYDLTMSNAADAANDITIAAGEATDETGEVVMVLPSAITKQLDAAWAVGNNAGGINTGAEAANTWYEVILIMRQDTGVVDVMFSTTANRATLPANYTHKRRIGWIRNDASSAIMAFTQVGDHFTLTTQVNDVAASKTTTATAATLTVPPNTIARFRATADMGTTVNANSVIVFSEIVEGNVTPALATGIGSIGYWDLATGVGVGHFELRANGSSQIEYDMDVAVGAFDISTFGWIDMRRRLDAN